MSQHETQGQDQKTLLILTVGTSLIGNARKEAGSDKRISDLNDSMNSNDYKIISKNFKKLLARDMIKKNLVRQGFVNPGNVLPVEITCMSIMSQNYPEYFPCEFVFISSDTLDGYRCARIMRDSIKSIRKSNCYLGAYSPLPLAKTSPTHTFEGTSLSVPERDEGLIIIPGLKVIGDTFTSNGMPNLIATLRDLMQSRKSTVITNPTGGFKGAIVTSTLVSQLMRNEDTRIHYLHESTPNIVEIPDYPVGADNDAWLQEEVLLDATVLGKKSSKKWAEIYERALSLRMRSVANDKIGNSFDKSISRILEDGFRESRNKNHFQHYAEKILKQFIINDYWRDVLSHLSSTIGPMIWQGDKLPMAANHSADHHYDLMRLAQQFLTPISDSLTDNERIILFGAIILHDCGHTLDRLYLKEDLNGKCIEDTGAHIPLFRSEIRNLHHFLAYHRLTNEKLKSQINWEGGKDISRAIEHLCIYHRKSTGWNKVDSITCPYLCETYPAPLKYSCKLSDVDFPKLVVLMRLIDGCDNQLNRVGAETQWRISGKQLEYDAKTFKIRLREQVYLFNSAGCIKNLPKRDMQVDKWIAATFMDQLNIWLDQHTKDIPTGLDKEYWDNFWYTRRYFGKICALNYAGKLGAVSFKPEEILSAQLWLEMAREFDEFIIRSGQEVHFLKHAAVKSIVILPDDDFSDDIWSYRITLQEDENLRKDLDDVNYAKKQASSISNCKTVRQWIENEISGELTQDSVDYIGKISLKSAKNIRFTFIWDDKEPFKIYEYKK